MRKKKNLNKHIHVRASQKTLKKLDDIANMYSMSKSQVLRILISNGWELNCKMRERG